MDYNDVGTIKKYLNKQSLKSFKLKFLFHETDRAVPIQPYIAHILLLLPRFSSDKKALGNVSLMKKVKRENKSFFYFTTTEMF
jgi:hypothetical protein